MRLINVHTLELEEFWGREPPLYAILSHTWGSEEVSFREWKDRESISHKAGYRKIRDVAQLTESFDIDYCWVDTNCIDKSSSAELSEAINSMFAWYSNALCCFVYLDDVASVDEEHSKKMRLKRRSGGYTFDALQDSRWFTRGWTLQELIAPACLVFLSKNWEIIGCLKKVSRGRDWPGVWLEHWFYMSTDQIQIIEEEIIDDISRITGIGRESLTIREDYEDQSIAVRMHWASKRKTTRVEDMAYCLLGLFKINMPLLYGEGSAAFQRLQEEIMKVSVDQSIFAWSSEPLGIEKDSGYISLMAPWPSAFTNKYIVRTKASPRAAVDSVYTLTNFGLSIQLPLLVDIRQQRYLAVLECADSRFLEPSANHVSKPERNTFYRLCIPLNKSEYDGTYSRVSPSKFPTAVRIENIPTTQRIHVPRLGRLVPSNVCSVSCETRVREGGRNYVFHMFTTPNQVISYVRPMAITNSCTFCPHCQRLIVERPTSGPDIAQICVVVAFQDRKPAGVWKRRFIFRVRIDFEKDRDSLSCDFTCCNPSFWNYVPGQILDKTRGRVELGLMAAQVRGPRGYRELPAFLGFDKADETQVERETTKMLVFEWDQESSSRIKIPGMDEEEAS
ncbi:hypothetical protein RRF57_008445 [Xylaria bambusicola]|uniref:Heterokaryon incompatibility domain-containing protein n=1 Tax=Xylaria bambusicola TaxID=326684 RepID=A0AAN7UTY7_9PEZI